MSTPPFHLAFPVTDLDATRRFYGELLGCEEGRSAPRWIDWNFFGHQISTHLVDSEAAQASTNAVDGDAVPVRHFGAILDMNSWRALADRLADAGVSFRIEPRVRFAGTRGEQATFFVDDPSGNSLEFKAFADPALIFAPFEQNNYE